MTSERLDVYVVIFRVDEITKQLHANQLNPTNRPRPSERSTSQLPTVNFIAQILGSRGSSLKTMNAEPGANIIVRGRVPDKEGRGRANLKTADYDRELLHCLIAANSQHKANETNKRI
ncbi:uncharacterized protein NECHADRAFT_85052 [Fusarium vanettenii 77-13-4]|uniref:Branchpoint-bridging protein n=1 Tax=Fusarium vanettenii (strain ATCC MYA-4622 / CBS 123669 / FGSC 9596 / NRRL 45880 / 77-13-4) TaxID=660122 RepID=C7YUV3_FUSV7|nr:uncharacterized protein NECHADRAFT_85052 [Fusarium vanettenii 77-13-4]EEU44473.1 hypothetical protein NECHADRAFT_85052 [Fusarium vanettenii 77-13-4]